MRGVGGGALEAWVNCHQAPFSFPRLGSRLGPRETRIVMPISQPKKLRLRELHLLKVTQAVSK